MFLVVQEVGLQSDERYARDFVAAKWREARWAPFRLKAELRRRGASGHDAEAAIAWLHEVRSILRDSLLSSFPPFPLVAVGAMMVSSIASPLWHGTGMHVRCVNAACYTPAHREL